MAKRPWSLSGRWMERPRMWNSVTMMHCRHAGCTNVQVQTTVSFHNLKQVIKRLMQGVKSYIYMHTAARTRLSTSHLSTIYIIWKLILDFELVSLNCYMPLWNSPQCLFLGRNMDVQLDEKQQAGDSLQFTFDCFTIVGVVSVYSHNLPLFLLSPPKSVGPIFWRHFLGRRGYFEIITENNVALFAFSNWTSFQWNLLK